MAAFSKKVYDPEDSALIAQVRARGELRWEDGNKTLDQLDRADGFPRLMRREARDAAHCNEWHRGVLVGGNFRVTP